MTKTQATEGLPRIKNQKRFTYQKSSTTTGWGAATNIFNDMLCPLLLMSNVSGKLSMASGHNPESQSFY